MEVIGKRINFINFHDFLDRIGVEQIYSTLHALYPLLTAGREPDEEFEYAGQYYTKTMLLSTMKQEEGLLSAIVFKGHPSNCCEVNLQFTSGNEIVVKIKSQEQYLQILNYLMEANKNES